MRSRARATALFTTACLMLGSSAQLNLHFGVSQRETLVGSLSVGRRKWLDMDQSTGSVHVNGSWRGAASGSLRFKDILTDHGSDPYGDFSRTTINWSFTDHGPVAISTAASVYPREQVAVFTATVLAPGGLHETNISRSSPIWQFPSFSTSRGLASQLGYAYWHGLWPQPVVSSNLTAWQPVRLPQRSEGPVLFTDVHGASLLVGPLDEPLNTVFAVTSPAAGQGGDERVLAFGPSGKLTSLPEGFCYSVAAVLGSGATDTIGRYGKMLLGHPASSSADVRALAARLSDPFLTKVSAWTDNGAFYYYNNQGKKVLPPIAEVLPAWIYQLRASGIPIQSVQLDGFWMNGSTSAPDNQMFPDWMQFRSDLGMDTNLLLYKAFFSEHYDLFKKYNSTQSPTGAWYPTGEDSSKFYAELFDAFVKLGAKAFETDFMSDHLLPTPGLAEHVQGLPLYHSGLASAALSRKLPVQFCMPTVAQVLVAAKFPAVTNVRVSTDYATERDPNETPTGWIPNYMIGIPDLLAWAVGLAPSKDLTVTRRLEPGGAIVSNHTNAEMDFVLSVLSTGPVGLGDGLNMTNLTLVHAGMREDGTILKPSKPLTAMDSTFRPTGRPHGLVGFLPLTSDPDCTIKSPCSPSLGQTHSALTLMPSYAAALGSKATPKQVACRLMLSMHLGSFVPLASELYPGYTNTFPPGAYREWRWRQCDPGERVFAKEESCLRSVNISAGLPDVSSGMHRADSTGADAWRLFHLFPSMPVPGGKAAWVFLGELGRIVPMSEQRFEAVGVNTTTDSKSCIEWTMLGSVGEVVRVSAVSPTGTYMEGNFVVTANTNGTFGLCEP